jgi:hypothetical protein
MITKNTTRFSLCAVAVFLLWNVFGATAFADTYNVNASVPYEAPSQPAVITTQTEGKVFRDVQQTIAGTCQVQNPASVVSIWRNGIVLGSVGCVSGTFSLPVMLQIGQNTIVVKTANASGLYGPDSPTRTIMVEHPVTAKPLPSGVNQPTTVGDQTAATNQGGISGLSLTTETPYAVLPTTKQATLRVVVGGGQQPYALQLKWGDGSTESHTLDQPGTYEFMHTYLVHKTYSVYVALRDVLGAYTEYTYAVISGTKSPSSTATDTEKATASPPREWRFVGLVWYCWVIILIVGLFLFSTYFLGYRRGRERSQVEAEQRLAAKKRKRKPKKK